MMLNFTRTLGLVEMPSKGCTHTVLVRVCPTKGLKHFR